MEKFSRNRIGKYFFRPVLILVCILMIALPSYAQGPDQSEKDAVTISDGEWKTIMTSPGVKIVSEQVTKPPIVFSGGEHNLREAAQDYLDKINLEQGLNHRGGKRLYVSVGSAVVSAPPDNPSFIDSRYLAFQKAELQAKVNTALFLGADISRSFGSSQKEFNPEERAELERIVNASPTIKKNLKSFGLKEKLFSLFEKTTKLAETKLDKAIEESGGDVSDINNKTAQNKTREIATRNKMNNLRTTDDTSIKVAASVFQEVQGTQVIQSFEGFYKDRYRIYVVTLWSQNLQRMVESMKTGVAPKGLDRRKSKAEIKKQLPSDSSKLVCFTGVRAYINQYGEHVLLSFAQSGVTVYGGNQAKAFERAERKAYLRAQAAFRTFMGEKIAFKADEELKEALAAYASEFAEGKGSEEYSSISQFMSKIQSVSHIKKITGIHGVMTKELEHPLTGKPLVLQVLAWSPSSQTMAKKVKKEMTQGVPAPKEKKIVSEEKEGVKNKKGFISSGEGADSDAW